MTNMCKDKPLVYVIMPAYNSAHFIEQAIRSVMCQTYQNWKLTVLDDGSSDCTVAVVKALMAEDDRISLIINEKNIGVAKTRNSALDLHAGNYVALLDSDDVWFPEKLERQVALMLEKNAAVTYCSYGIIDANGRKSCEDFIVPASANFEQFLSKSVISCSTALLSPKITELYRFRTDIYHEDLEFWLRILHDGNYACGIDSVLAQYRVMKGTRASNKIRSALYRWKIYRSIMGFSACKCACIMIRYIFLGLKKYRRHME